MSNSLTLSAAPDSDPDFSLLTSFSYLPAEPASFNLDRHLNRLEEGHRTLADHLQDSWCAKTEHASSQDVAAAISNALGALSEPSRIRVCLPRSGKPVIENFPLTPMPDYRVKLVLDDRPTEYEGDPFMIVKTTNRKKYDDARARRGATLSPSNEPDAAPFDVILYNPQDEITETTISNIAFKFSQHDAVWITPSSKSGLLAGVKRSELIEVGEIKEGIIKVEQVAKAAEEGTLQVICFNGVRGVFPAFVQIN